MKRKAVLARAREGGTPNEAFVLVQVANLFDVALALADAAGIDMQVQIVGRLPDGTEIMHMETTDIENPERWTAGRAPR